MDVKSTLQWDMPVSVGLLVALAAAAFAGFALLRKAGGRPIDVARRPGLLALRAAILGVLAAIILNPVRVDETPGSIERPKVFYLVDSSRSMALGKGSTRWDQVGRTIREAERSVPPETGPQVGVFRFGSRLAAVESPFWRVAPPGTAQVAEPARPPTPTDSDTLLAGSLEALAGRFGQTPPQAVVLFSDGRARDPGRIDPIARGYGRMRVPIHVVPVGDADVGGDVAIVSMVAPALVRKNTRVAVQLFVRSYGFKGKRAEVKLSALGPDGKPGAQLAREPIVLRDGLHPYTLAFESGEQDRRIEARIDTQPGEVSAANNAVAADLAIDHTKIRILYLEGSNERYVVNRGIFGLGGSEVKGAYSPLQDALMEDPDVECVAILPGGPGGNFSSLVRTDERGRGLPETPSELFAYDAIILSNVPRDALSDPHLAWVDDWIGRRGGGLCMVGGPNSFASGNWADTSVGRMLPVELPSAGPDWTDPLTTLQPVASGAIHPIWHVTPDDVRNRALLKTIPPFAGSNAAGAAKPNADVIAWSDARPGDQARAVGVAVQPFGRGRTMAMTTAISRRWAPDFAKTWGEGDARYYKKFWRNVAYWLTENSSIGRRRLLAETDKRLYRPGEPIALKAGAFDENASPTTDYRVVVSVEPKSAGDGASDNSPLLRPEGVPRPADAKGPLVAWGEEFELARVPAEKGYAVALPIADSRSLPAGNAPSQGLRIELTAYEGNTQVDSTALDVQVLDDPSEQQNPMPDHDLLRRVAEDSGGKVLRNAGDLSAMLTRLPISMGAPEIKKVPAWSRWWLLAALLGLITAEWVWRRRLGLA